VEKRGRFILYRSEQARGAICLDWDMNTPKLTRIGIEIGMRNESAFLIIWHGNKRMVAMSQSGQEYGLIRIDVKPVFLLPPTHTTTTSRTNDPSDRMEH